MTILCSEIRQLCTKTYVERLNRVFFLYPKLVIFETLKSFLIIDLLSSKEHGSEVQYFDLAQDAKDILIKDQLLWILMNNEELALIEVMRGVQLKIIINNYANYKVDRFHVIENKVLLSSESGEILAVPHSTSEISAWFDQGLQESKISLERVRTNKKDLDPKDNTEPVLYGLQVREESGEISLQCPFTGLTEIISAPAKVTGVVTWNDMIICTNTSKMWLMNLITGTVLHEFKDNSLNYHPVGTYKGMLYYLQWIKDKITVNYATDASPNTSFQNYESCPTPKEASQETLKAEVESICAAALSNADYGQVLNQLKGLYRKIDDCIFLLHISTRLCQYNIAYKPLLHLLQKNPNCIQNVEILHLLADLLIKVELLEYITFKGSNSMYEKHDLFEQNYVQLCQLFVSKSDIDLASICWLKYLGLDSKLSNNDVLDILNATPNNIKLSTLIIWLRNFVPPLLDENPYFIDVISKWTSERVFLLEQSGYWPKIGLKFIDDVVNVLQSSLNSVCLRPISIDDLDSLKDHINYIMELKEKYKINMLINEITSQSAYEVALIMLRRCYTEDLASFLQHFLQNFALRYLLEVDDLLSSYIETQTAACGGGIEGLRLKILLDAFQTPTKKLECLLLVLKVLDVPWENSILDLSVSTAGNIFKDFTVSDADRNLAQEIQKEINYAQVKVVLKKYNFPLTCTDFTLVLHKLINAPAVDLNDFKIITKVMSPHTSYGNILYIDRCLRDCETKVALDFFNSLNSTDKKILLKTVLAKYEQQLYNNANNDTERNYLDFLKGTKLLSNVEIDNIESLYYLKNSYNLNLSLNSINNEKSCQEIANEWISRDEVTASSGCGRCVSQLTGSLQTRDSILIALLCRTSTSNKVRKKVESLILLLPFDGNALKADLLPILLELESKTDLLITSFSVLTELVVHCPEEYIHYLVRCLSILNGLLNTNVVVKNLTMVWKFHYVFLSMSSTNPNDLIEIYAKILSRNFEDIEKLSNKSALSIFRNICDIQEYVTSSDFEKTNIQPDQDRVYNALKYKQAHKLLIKVIAAQKLDEVILTSLLLILNGDKKLEDSMWILDILQGQADSLPISLTSYLSLPAIRRTFSLDTILPGNSVSYPPQYILKSKFNINLADMALSEGTEETWDVKVVLFCVLRQHLNTDFDRLVELCNTLNVSVNDGLSLQLIAMLTTWELEYSVVYEDISCKHIYVRNDEKSLAAKSVLIWDSITDKTFIKDILSDFWKNGEVTLHGRSVSINPYYYEVYICIYNLVYGALSDLKHKKAYFLLNFLKEYKRKSAPKQFEFELFSVKGMFPEIGYYRLPFHLFTREDMWSNLKSEITLETYELWLPAVDLLSLDADLQTAKDMICSNAVKQTMTSRKPSETFSDEESKENESWRLIVREEPLLRAAHRCVKYISNMEWAAACLFYVLQGCARGADQVAAAQLCYQFAQRWAALQPGNRAVRQMERLHSTLSTRHALHKIEWARDEFVRLSAEPAQLIRALYLHPDFISKMSRYDVNRAADEIADKNGINISSIRIQLLESILTRNNENNKTGSHGLEINKLITAKYILKATCPKMGAIYLSRIAFDEDSDFNKSKKLRALQCLMSVVDSDTAIKVTNKARDALWTSLLDLLFIVNLESIDLPWIVATFVHNKVQALEQLIQTSGNNIECIRIAAALARRFGNFTIICDLLPLLLRSALYEEIESLLLKLSCPPDDIIYTSWRAIILAPFQQADYPITERQKAKCLNAINLLPICPVIKDDDLIEIWKNCLRCKCIGLGCLILPYISPEKRQTLKEIQRIDKRNLIASLKNLHSETYLVPGAMHVVESMTSRSFGKTPNH